MWEDLKYDLSMMTLPNVLKTFLPILLFFGSWIYVPYYKSNYRCRRKKFERTFDAETCGQISSIRKLYHPAGEDGIIRLKGHEITYQMTIDEISYQNTLSVPSQVDWAIHKKLAQWVKGETEALIRYQSNDPAKNTIKLIDFVY